jgi:hypothetical protein
MLSDQLLQLLTAFVDGELSQRQRMEVVQLLEKSSEAREILKQLQENAHRLKMLPRHKVEPSLVDDIMQAINEHKSQPKPASAPGTRRRRWMPYLAATLAASLMVAAIGLMYWKATQETNPGPKENFVDNNNPKPEPKPAPEPQPTPKRVNPNLAVLSKITGATVHDFASVVPDFSASFAELKKDGKATGRLVAELNREKSVQLEVTVKSNSEAMKRLQYVLKYQDIKVVADPGVYKPVDNKKVEYLVYADNLTRDELTKLVNELSDSYVVGNNGNQKTVATPYQKVTVTPLAQDEKLKVAKLLGVDAKTLERKEAKSGKSERVVLLLPRTADAKQPSAEVRQFVNQRRGAQPGAVQVLIKIRQE